MRLFVPLGFIIALVLAIPTIGLSLVGFFLIKYMIDLQGASSITAAAFNAYNSDNPVVAPFVNNAAIRKFFAKYGTTEKKYDSFHGKGLTFLGFVRLGEQETVAIIIKGRDATHVSTIDPPYQFKNDLTSLTGR